MYVYVLIRYIHLFFRNIINTCVNLMRLFEIYWFYMGQVFHQNLLAIRRGALSKWDTFVNVINNVDMFFFLNIKW